MFNFFRKMDKMGNNENCEPSSETGPLNNEMPQPRSLEERCDYFRLVIKDTGTQVKKLLNHSTFEGEQMFEGQHSEMKANIMLAYRHLEDARMRIGKVMQQIQGGVSKFDK